MTRHHHHEIGATSWAGRGWQTSCSCRHTFPVRRTPGAADRDGARHLVDSRLAELAARHRSGEGFARAVRADGELAAVLHVLHEHREPAA